MEKTSFHIIINNWIFAIKFQKEILTSANKGASHNPLPYTCLTFFISWNSSDNIRLMWSCCNACSTSSHGNIHNATPTLINLLRVSPAARRTFWSCDPQNANSCSRAFPNSLGNVLWCLLGGDADTDTIGLHLTSQLAISTTHRHSLIVG